MIVRCQFFITGDTIQYMKNNYFFILGRNPALAIAEIEALLDKNILERLIGPDFFIIKTKSEIDLYSLQKRLGGTIKVGNIIKESETDPEKEIFEIILKKITTRRDPVCGIKDKKLNFGINEYGQKIDALGIKRILKNEGKSVRLVTSKEKNLSSVISKKEILDKDGVEINIFKINKEVYIGETHVVQFFEEMSLRDWERPGKDRLSGMLPPQLAKIMINLAGSDVSGTLLDPFCGSGTVLTEAAIMGYDKLTGSDISEKAIEDTKKNFSWLKDNEFVKKTINPILYHLDVRNIEGRVAPDSTDVIVTEPFLGPPLKKSSTLDEVNEIKLDLEDLYLDAFRVFEKLLKKSGIIVIIFPSFLMKEKIFLDILPQIKKMGFKIKNPLQHIDYKFSETTERGSILYSRAGQKVGREIFLFIR